MLVLTFYFTKKWILFFFKFPLVISGIDLQTKTGKHVYNWYIQKYISYFEKKVSNGALNYTVIYIFGLSRVKYVTNQI